LKEDAREGIASVVRRKRVMDQTKSSTTDHARTHIKVVTAGTGGVGKSATVVYLVSGIFLDYYDPTIEDLHRKTLRVGEEDYMLSILDTAGQEEFYAPCTPTALLSAMQGEWFRTGDAFLLMYAINDRSSLKGSESILQRIIRVRESRMEEVAIVVVGNKCDLEDQREVTREEGEALAASMGSRFFEISAKEGFNVYEVFEAIVREVEKKREIKRQREEELNPPPKQMSFRRSRSRSRGETSAPLQKSGGGTSAPPLKKRCSLI